MAHSPQTVLDEAPAPAFDHQTLEAARCAYNVVCLELGLTTAGDKATEMVAMKVMELASGGIHHPDVLAAEALAYFRGPPGAHTEAVGSIPYSPLPT